MYWCEVVTLPWATVIWVIVGWLHAGCIIFTCTVWLQWSGRIVFSRLCSWHACRNVYTHTGTPLTHRAGYVHCRVCVCWTERENYLFYKITRCFELYLDEIDCCYLCLHSSTSFFVLFQVIREIYTSSENWQLSRKVLATVQVPSVILYFMISQ